MKIQKREKSWGQISEMQKRLDPLWNGGWTITIKVFGGLQNTSHKYLIIALFKAVNVIIQDWKVRWRIAKYLNGNKRR